MSRTKRGPGAVQEEPPSNRGGKAVARRSSVSGKRVRVPNEDDPALRDALGLPPSRSDPAAIIAVVQTAGDNGDAPWRTYFEPENDRRPTITEPSTPLEAGNKEVDFEVERPRYEGWRLSPLNTARNRAGSVPPGFASRNLLNAREVVDLMGEPHRTRDKEK